MIYKVLCKEKVKSKWKDITKEFSIEFPYTFSGRVGKYLPTKTKINKLPPKLYSFVCNVPEDKYLATRQYLAKNDYKRQGEGEIYVQGPAKKLYRGMIIPKNYIGIYCYKKEVTNGKPNTATINH